jgi:hypothetical protein
VKEREREMRRRKREALIVTAHTSSWEHWSGVSVLEPNLDMILDSPMLYSMSSSSVKLWSISADLRTSCAYAEEVKAHVSDFLS